jgi:transcriptional regulator with XRE-family HTH domain
MKTKQDKTDFLVKQGRLLKYARQQSDYTLQNASEAIGKSRTWLSDIEAGRNDIFFVDVTKLADLYGADVNEWAKELKE